MSVALPLPDPGLTQVRQYSFSNAPGDGIWRITVKRVDARGDAPAGMVSGRIHSAVEVGDRLRVGDLDYEVRATIAAEPDRTANVFTLGPRVMVPVESLAQTGLVQPGSLVRWLYRVALHDPAGAPGDRKSVV